MGSTRALLRVLILLVVLSMVAAACTGGGDDPDGGDGSETTEGGGGGGTGTSPDTETLSTFIVEPEALMPTNSNESEGNAVLDALCTTLVEYDPETTEPINAHAESIESDDLTTWTIKIKEGWTFHNGDPVTAQSYVDSWNYAAYGPNAQGTSSFFGNIEGFADVNPEDPDGEGPEEAPEPKSETMSGLKAVDDTTLEVTLSDAFPQFPLTIGYEAFCPMPQAAFDDPEAFNEQPILNGPFMMDGPWEHQQAIKTVAFEEYQGEDKAQVPGFEFRIYADQGTAYNDFVDGSLDIMDELPPEHIATAEEEFGDQYGESPDSGYNYIGFPLYDKQFADKTLRQALSLAIDRESIVETIFSGGRLPADSFISPVIPGYRENACPDTVAFNPEKAKQLYEEAGGLKTPVTVWFNTGGGHAEWVEAVTNGWTEVFELDPSANNFEFRSLGFDQYLGLGDEKGFTGPFRLGWGMDYPSPQNYLEPLWGSQSTPPGGSNSSFFSNKEFDDLIAEGNKQDSLEEGIPFYQQAEDILCDEMPGIPIHFGVNQYLHSPRVEGLKVDAFGNINYSGITIVE